MLLRRRRNSRGSAMVETAVLYLAIVAALVAFYSFIRSAVSSRLKTGADAFGKGMLHDGS
jgi:Flp pilus assembly pilin Flp